MRGRRLNRLASAAPASPVSLAQAGDGEVMPVTIRDVARHAGVDAGTVSRALRGRRHVSEACAKRVAEAVAALGYQPLRRRVTNHEASLRGSVVGVVLLGMHHSLSALPAVQTVIRTVELDLRTAGAEVVHLDVPDLRTIPAALARGRLDALVLKSAMQGGLPDPGNAVLARMRRLPSVWATGRPADAWGDAAGADDHAAGVLAANHLITRGHRRLAVLNPKPDHVLFRRRVDGFLSAARVAGIDAALIAPALPAAQRRWRLPLRAVEPGDEDIITLLDRAFTQDPHAHAPTALFTPADSIGVVVHRELRRRQLRIGRDVGLVSCNHEPDLLTDLEPALTTVDIQLAEIGHLAVDLLARRLRVGPDRPAVDLLVTPRLVMGKTT